MKILFGAESMTSSNSKTGYTEKLGPYFVICMMFATMGFLFWLGETGAAGTILGVLVVPATKKIMQLNGHDED